MPRKLKIGGLTVPGEQADKVQRAIVNKYTLVPLTAVIATAVLTASVMWSLMTERARILVLETKVKAIQEANGTMSKKLREIHDDLLMIKVKLDIGSMTDAATRSNDGI